MEINGNKPRILCTKTKNDVKAKARTMRRRRRNRKTGKTIKMAQAKTEERGGVKAEVFLLMLNNCWFVPLVLLFFLLLVLFLLSKTFKNFHFPTCAIAIFICWCEILLFRAIVLDDKKKMEGGGALPLSGSLPNILLVFLI